MKKREKREKRELVVAELYWSSVIVEVRERKSTEEDEEERETIEK